MYARQRAAATTIAAAARALPCRRELAASVLAATTLQAAARRKACVARYKVQRAAIVRAEALARGKAARRLWAIVGRCIRLLQATVRRRLEYRAWAAAVLQKAAAPWLRELMRARRAREKIINTRAVDDLMMTIALTPRPPQHKKAATAPRAGVARSATVVARPDRSGEAGLLVASDRPPASEQLLRMQLGRQPPPGRRVPPGAVSLTPPGRRAPAGATVKELLSKASGPRRWAGEGLGFDEDALQQIPGKHRPAYQKGTAVAAAPPSGLPLPGVGTVEAWSTPPHQKSVGHAHGDDLMDKLRREAAGNQDDLMNKLRREAAAEQAGLVAQSPRSHILTDDPSKGFVTYVARRSGPLDGPQLPPLDPKAVMIRPRRPYDSSYF